MSEESGLEPPEGIERQHWRIINDHSDPVTFVSELTSLEEWTVTRQQTHNRVNKLIEAGHLDVKQKGKVKVFWPAGKWENIEDERDDLEAKVEQLRGVNKHLEGRADELEDELEETRRALEEHANDSERWYLPFGSSSELADDVLDRWAGRAALAATVAFLGCVLTTLMLLVRLTASATSGIISGLIDPAVISGIATFATIVAASATAVAILAVLLSLLFQATPSAATTVDRLLP